jgi:AcrR family transcriptional regulator
MSVTPSAKRLIAGENPAARLMNGLVAAVAEKGYPRTTVADIARHARVSLRTFYEHFDSKEACLYSCYRSTAERALQQIEAAARPGDAWEKQVEASVHAFVAVVDAQPEFTRALIVQVPAIGPEGQKLRNEMHRRFADLLLDLVARAHPRTKVRELLPPDMALTIVGGISELLLVTLERDSKNRLQQWQATAVNLIRRSLLLPDATPKRRRKA